jgi:glycosyltransferase involved in cell wall biosynthesis
MISDPLVSVITPVFNGAEFLRVSIDSVLSQDYPSIELIVVDGESADGTLDILRSYGDRITWFSEKDRGQSDAINKGSARSAGTILTWLNADDYFMPGAVRRAVEVFKTNPDVALVYGRLQLVYRDGTPRRFDHQVREASYHELLQWDNLVGQPGVFYSRAAWDACGPLSLVDHYAMDWDLWIKIARQFPIKYTPQIFAAFRTYPESKTGSGGLERLEEIRVMLERNGSRAPHLYYKIGLWHYQNNQMREARQFLFQALKRGPSPRICGETIGLIAKSYLGGSVVDIGRALNRSLSRRGRP